MQDLLIAVCVSSRRSPATPAGALAAIERALQGPAGVAFSSWLTHHEAALAELQARISALEAALRPFAVAVQLPDDCAPGVDGAPVQIEVRTGAVRRAQQALERASTHEQA